MKSQAQFILEALQTGKSITPMDALNRWGCFRLGARVYDLRRKGYEIENVGRDDVNYACYRLRKSATEPKAYTCLMGAYHEVGCPHEEGKEFAARATKAIYPSKPKIESQQPLF